MDPSRGGGDGGGGGAGPPGDGDGNDQMCVRRGVRVPVVSLSVARSSRVVVPSLPGRGAVPTSEDFVGRRGRGIEGRFGVGSSD
jgi:hypothetical protein